MNDPLHKMFVDSYNCPIATWTEGVDLADKSMPEVTVTEQSVRDELAARHFIYIPPRRSLARTPELTAKRDILMQLVYQGQISIDLSRSQPNGEVGLVFWNSRPLR